MLPHLGSPPTPEPKNSQTTSELQPSCGAPPPANVNVVGPPISIKRPSTSHDDANHKPNETASTISTHTNRSWQHWGLCCYEQRQLPLDSQLEMSCVVSDALEQQHLRHERPIAAATAAAAEAVAEAAAEAAAAAMAMVSLCSKGGVFLIPGEVSLPRYPWFVWWVRGMVVVMSFSASAQVTQQSNRGLRQVVPVSFSTSTQTRRPH